MTSCQSEEKETYTPETVMKKLKQCETEMGQQVEALRGELQEHKDAFELMKSEWDTFVKEFTELYLMIKNAKVVFNFFGWIGKAVRWIALTGIAVGTIIAGIKSGLWK